MTYSHNLNIAWFCQKKVTRSSTANPTEILTIELLQKNQELDFSIQEQKQT